MVLSTMSSSGHCDRLQVVGREAEYGMRDDAGLLDQVRQLIVDLVITDERRSCNVSLYSERISDCDSKQTEGTQHVTCHFCNNNEMDVDSTARETCILTDKLAHVLLELAVEQDNLRLAAKAGNALLEELKCAREEIDTLHDEVEVTQGECDRFMREAQRLRDQNISLEAEMQRYNGLHDGTGLRPSLTPFSGRANRIDSCERCGSQEVEMAQLEHRGNELKRQFIELELTRERDQQRQQELTEEITRLRQRNHEQHAETAYAQQELECVMTQLNEQSQELERVQAGRDSLRCMTRRLEAENQELRDLITVRDELVARLESGQVRAVTQLQVAANRAQAETKRVTETLQLMEEHFESARRRASGIRREVAVKSQEETEGLEQLLQDALRQVAALRMENQLLRQDANDMSLGGGSRRQTADIVTTAADVLACKSPSTIEFLKRDNEDELITQPRSDLPPLDIESIICMDNDASTETNTQLVVKDGNTRRRMSLELEWDQQTSLLPDITPVALQNFDDESTKSFLLTEIEDEQQSFIHAPLILKRPAARFHLNFGNGQNLIHRVTETHSPIMHLCDGDGKREMQESLATTAPAPQSSIEKIRRDAADSPPKSPIYLGLSFIACATAATAAGLLVRR
ncbi:hypothetical protein Plhal304r1_c002g0005041 [Plasmopara halstedii]